MPLSDLISSGEWESLWSCVFSWSDLLACVQLLKQDLSVLQESSPDLDLFSCDACSQPKTSGWKSRSFCFAQTLLADLPPLPYESRPKPSDFWGRFSCINVFLMNALCVLGVASALCKTKKRVCESFLLTHAFVYAQGPRAQAIRVWLENVRVLACLQAYSYKTDFTRSFPQPQSTQG